MGNQESPSVSFKYDPVVAAEYDNRRREMNRRLNFLDDEQRRELKYYRNAISRKTARLARRAPSILIFDRQGQPAFVSPDIIEMCHQWMDERNIPRI